MKILATSFLSLIFASFCFAQELSEVCTEAQKYVAEDKPYKALQELSWSVSELAESHKKKLESFLPTKLSSFSSADDKFPTISLSIDNISISKKYVNGNDDVLVGIATKDPFKDRKLGNPTAALMRDAKRFRFKGRTAYFSDAYSNNMMTIELPKDAHISLQSRKLENAEETFKKLAEDIDLDAIETYLNQ